MSTEAAKYHISPTTGNPNRCYASKRPCPLGGEKDHYESKDDARAAYEERMRENSQNASQSHKRSRDATGDSSNVVSMVSHPKSPEVKREKFKEAVIELRVDLSKEETGTLNRLGDGKKVSADKLDRLARKASKLTNKTPYRRESTVEAAKTVSEFVKSERDKDPTPNTTQTLRQFDPAAQTTFSNPGARKSANVASKSMARNAAHAKWMEKLADDAARASRDVTYSEAERKEWGNLRDEQMEEATETRALLQAQLREVTYLSDNDSNFKSSLSTQARASMSDHRARRERETTEYDSIPLDVKKVR